jgi:hypothetical protein
VQRFRAAIALFLYFSQRHPPSRKRYGGQAELTELSIFFEYFVFFVVKKIQSGNNALLKITTVAVPHSFVVNGATARTAREKQQPLQLYSA